MAVQHGHLIDVLGKAMSEGRKVNFIPHQCQKANQDAQHGVEDPADQLMT